MILFIISKLFAFIQSAQTWSLWADLIQPDMIQSDLILSLLFDPLTLICYDYLYSSYSKLIQSARSLFPSQLSTLRFLVILTLIRIKYY